MNRRSFFGMVIGLPLALKALARPYEYQPLKLAKAKELWDGQKTLIEWDWKTYEMKDGKWVETAQGLNPPPPLVKKAGRRFTTTY